MRLQELGYVETVFGYSPKNRIRIRAVGLEIILWEIAESRSDVKSFSFPGPEITVNTGNGDFKHKLAMSIEFNDGVTGAFEYLNRKQFDAGLGPFLSDKANQIRMRLELFDNKYWQSHEAHYSAWRRLVRFIHPKLQIESWELCERICSVSWPKARLPISDIAKHFQVDKQTILTAVAFLIHQGHLMFDSERGEYDLSSKVWKKS